MSGRRISVEFKHEGCHLIETPDRTAVHGPAGATSITAYLSCTGAALWALMMALQPDPGFSASWPWMALFWALQIGVGLVVLQSALYAMSLADRAGRFPLWALVAGSGVAGSVLLAPIYWLIGEGLMERMLGFAATVDADDLFGPPLGFGLAALLQEFGDIVGPVTAAWALISWPRLPGLLPPPVARPQPKTAPSETRTSPPDESKPIAVRPSWRDALPAELGDDLIAVTSELQYLRVWTTRGCALVLGALQEVEQAEGLAGMRIHRSWWVHAGHVRGVRRSGDAALCELSDGREVPVSRRRKAEVLTRFGDSARYAVEPLVPVTAPRTRDQNARRSPT